MMNMDYESPPDNNTDYAHATHWTIKWTCRCGKQHVTSSPGRYVTQTCKKCGVRWEIAPHFHDTTYHECATEPITGAAEIESQPQDGRRVENRVSALENSLFKLSEDHNTTLRQMIDLQRQVETNNRLYGLLKGRLDGIDEDQADLQRQVRQLTAIIERHHELLTPQLMHPTPPQPVVDPESPEQHEAVMSVLEKAITVPRRSQLDTLAGDILTALAGQIGGTNG